MGLNLTIGYAGQKSLGHAAFFGIGAYTVAILLKAGISFWVGLPLAMLGCFVIGLALGFPALRVQTIYLAFATLGFNTAVWLVMRNEEWLTGGTFGINGIVRPGFLGLDLNKSLAYYYFVLRCHHRARRTAVEAAAFALGQGLHRAARQPDPGREPGRQHHRPTRCSSFAIGAVCARAWAARCFGIAGRVHRAAGTVHTSATSLTMLPRRSSSAAAG